MGNKVLVYETTEQELRSRSRLDPHFSHDDKGPVARFRGNTAGATMGTMFASSLMVMRNII